MAITQEEVRMVKADTMVEEDTITKVDIKTILQEGEDDGYVTKRTISVHIALTKIELN